MWFLWSFKYCPDWLLHEIEKSDIDLFILCNTDIPWIPDKVRENGGENRERLFEIYDNLYNVKTIQELVEEGAYKACKELILSKINHPSKYRTEISPELVAKEVRLKFPYHKMPRGYEQSRNFFVASICNLTSETIYLLLNVA